MCPSRKLIILEFLHKALSDGANFFLKGNLSENRSVNNESLSSSAQPIRNKESNYILRESLNSSSNHIFNICRESFERFPLNERNCFLEKIELLEVEKRELYVASAQTQELLNQCRIELESLKNSEENLIENTASTFEVNLLKEQLQNSEEREKELINTQKLHVAELQNEIFTLKENLNALQVSFNQSKRLEEELKKETDTLRRKNEGGIKSLQEELNSISRNSNIRIEEEQQRNRDLEVKNRPSNKS
jgi:hypothetical protein